MTVLPNDAVSPQAGQSVSLLDDLKAQPVWLLWRSEPDRDPKKKPRKVPYYVGGGRREGALDSPEDRAKLVIFAEAAAKHAALAGTFEGLAIALGPDGRGGCWQGVDLDDIVATGVTDIADLWTRGGCAGLGYVEASPSEKGLHLIGYGRQFQTLGPNSCGIEAYAGGRFFTFTGRAVVGDSLCKRYDLADYVEQVLAPRHGSARSQPANDADAVIVDEKTVTELRLALFHMPSDDRSLWVAVGHALKELGDTGRGLWMAWSATSDKFDPKDAASKWGTFAPRRTGYQAVFKMAQERGWVNPGSKAAQPDPITPDLSAPSTVTLEFAMSSDTATITLEYLLDPFLPARCVVGAFGRGSTAKSSFYATVAAHISSYASTLWVSVEEPADWIKARHIKCGGQEHTLAVVKAVASKKDAQGRVIASSFNIYEHLEPAIADACAGFSLAQKPPLRLVTLDTAVGLTGWAKGESPNDDASVKKLLGYLQALAERHNLTIIAIGHANKGKHEYFADTVMGASAWTNSPRLSFVHASDIREDYSYVMRVAKTNFDPFGVPYQTEPVHTLFERAHGPDTVLVKVTPGNIVWGETASMEMFMDATKKPRDDDGPSSDQPMPRAQTLPESVLQALVDMALSLDSPLQFVTREQVHERIGKVVDRARWRRIEDHLHNHPQVVVTRGDKNRAEYRKRL